MTLLSKVMALQCFRRYFTAGLAPMNARSPNPTKSAHETDSCGIPTQPTWSVNQLLSSYPSPRISPQTVDRLYELSALVPPAQDTLQHGAVIKDLEEIIRLVEAVRLVDTSGISLMGRGEKADADKIVTYFEGVEKNGQTLLKHAARTQDNFYVVDSDRKR